MSKINELIMTYCPSGVEYKSLGELGKFYGGLTGKKKSDFQDGNAIFISYKNVFSNPALDINPDERVKINEGEKQRTLEYGDVIFTGSSETPEECGYSSVVTEHPQENLYLNSFCFVFKFDNISAINPNFVKHLFRSEGLRKQIVKTASGVTRFNVSKKLMEKVVIPIPPISVQTEIANILDKYMCLNNELNGLLNKEIIDRKKQYEYYRNKILEIPNEEVVLEIPLSEVYDFKYGTGNNIPTGGGEYPVYGSNGIAGWHTEYNSEDAPVIGHIGAYAGIVNWAEGKHFVTYNGVICKHKNSSVDKKYAYYLLLIQDFLSDQKGAQPFVSYDALKKPIVKIPTMERQKEIVKILELYLQEQNAIIEELNREIDFRCKQYNFYCNMLLTFTRAGEE